MYIEYPGLDASEPVYHIFFFIVDRSGNRIPSVTKMTELTNHAFLTISGSLAKEAKFVFPKHEEEYQT